MIFERIKEEQRSNAIKLLENSLFDRVTMGAQWFKDVPPTFPGFVESMSHKKSNGNNGQNFTLRIGN